MTEEHTLWIEKYRPQSLEDFQGQDIIKERVAAMLKQGSIPHLLFAGPAGSGKTTLSLIIAKQLFGDTWQHNILALNASDSRGIDVIRNEVKDFARTKSMHGKIKIIFLDEADALTREAQQALRRTMEIYAHSTRFILSCNFSSKIIDPISSRCTVFRFRPLEKEALSNVIDNISKKENLKIAGDAKESLINLSHGDVRRAENILQSCASINKTITKNSIFEIVSAAQPEEIRSVLALAINKDFIKSRSKLLDVMLKQGLSGLDIIKQVSEETWNLKVSDEIKYQILVHCGETEFRMVEGADEFLQLEAFLARLSSL
ncbi:MAG: replication factor C small subunit [Nanoarchaeota archaeon]